VLREIDFQNLFDIFDCVTFVASHRRSQEESKGPWIAHIFKISSDFVLREAVSQTNNYC